MHVPNCSPLHFLCVAEYAPLINVHVTISNQLRDGYDKDNKVIIRVYRDSQVIQNMASAMHAISTYIGYTRRHLYELIG